MKTSSVMNGHVWDTVHTHTYNTWKKTVWSLAEFAYTFTRTMFLYYKTRHYAPSNIASLQVVLGGDYISIKIYSIIIMILINIINIIIITIISSSGSSYYQEMAQTLSPPSVSPPSVLPQHRYDYSMLNP